VINRFTIPLAVFIVLLGFLGIGLTLKPNELPSPFIDRPAPAFSLPELLLPGEQFGNADLEGEVWLLNVWASWCVACRQEHPLLNRLAQTGAVTIVGLNYKDEADAAAAWLQQLGNPYTHIPADNSGDVGIEYGVYGVPETFVIDRKGLVRYKHIGPLTEESLQQTLMPLVTELQKEPS
jgi:cytochrome c biogenesis protein CcmG/thiol:disulfide interchange protein DsbE